MTYADFAAQVRRELEEVTPSVWADDSLLAWTNDGITDFALRTKALTDEVYADTVAGQQSYDLPDYTLEPKAVFYNGNQLVRESFNKWYGLTGEGTPAYYTWSSGSLYLRPIPTEEQQMRVFRTRLPDPIASDSDSMPFEGRYDATLRAYVKASAWQQVGDFDQFKLCQDEYERSLQAAIAERMNEDGANMASEPVETY